MTTSEDPNTLIGKLFQGTMIADEWNVVSSVKRSFNKNGSIKSDTDLHHLTFISADDRIAEAIEEIAKWSEQTTKKEGVPFDLVVTPLATGSKEYIEWVKEQCLKKDDSAAFFNEEAKPALKANTETVEEKEKKAKDDSNVQTSESTSDSEHKSLWSSDDNDDEDDE